MIWAKLVGWITGGGISAIGQQITNAYELKLKAQNDEDRIEADKQIAYLTARQNILIAEQGSWMTRWIRPAFALPFVIYDFKIVVWDKVLGLGVTDDLSPEFWQLQMIVFGAFFVMRPLEKRR